jgi:hypothetical protein
LPHGNRNVDDALLYTYIGGGVPNQPPNTYPLVFKHMPLDIAALVLAEGMKLMPCSPSAGMIYCRDVGKSPEELRQKETEFAGKAQALMREGS